MKTARTIRKAGPSKKQKPRTFTAQETDTIIAALRLWQRSPAYPEIDISEEHGDMLSDSGIDDLIEKVNFGDVRDMPKSTVHQDLVSLAELVAAGNTDYEGLERRANEVLIRVRR